MNLTNVEIEMLDKFGLIYFLAYIRLTRIDLNLIKDLPNKEKLIKIELEIKRYENYINIIEYECIKHLNDYDKEQLENINKYIKEEKEYIEYLKKLVITNQITNYNKQIPYDIATSKKERRYTWVTINGMSRKVYDDEYNGWGWIIISGFFIVLGIVLVCVYCCN